MEPMIFDYRETEEPAEEIEDLLGELSPQETRKVREMITSAKKDHEKEQIKAWQASFQEMILPWIKLYAQEQGAHLRISEDAPGLIVATMTESAFTLENTSRAARIILSAANSALFEVNEGEGVLSLIYDYKR